MKHDVIKTELLEGLEVSLFDYAGEIKSMADLEGEIVGKVLEHCGGNVSKASKILGLARSTFYRKLGGK